MTPSKHQRGTGMLLVKGVEQAPVQYEISTSEQDMVTRTEASIEGSLGPLAYAQSSSQVQLRLSDGRILDVSVGTFNAAFNPTRAELIVHGGL